MIFYRTGSTDPHFNLAFEEYTVRAAGDETVFMLWQNSPSVIIGRNQNAFAEIDIAFAEAHGIPAVRRLTGGGAVYHDLGNVNYTFVAPAKDGAVLDYAGFCAPLIDALRTLGVDASLSGRNDIVCDGRKISGSAQCVTHGHVLHHGTLLWSADTGVMSAVLTPDAEKLRSKGIRSTASRVGSIREMLRAPGGSGAGGLTENAGPGGCSAGLPYISADSTASDFMNWLASYVCASEKCDVRYPSEREAGEARRLMKEKYATWEWNYGRSGHFVASSSRRFPYGTVTAEYTLEGGRIASVRFSGDFFGASPVSELAERLGGCRCSGPELVRALGGVGGYIEGAAPEEIAALFM